MFQAIEGLWPGRGEVIAEIALPRELERDLSRYHLLSGAARRELSGFAGGGSWETDPDNRVQPGNLCTLARPDKPGRISIGLQGRASGVMAGFAMNSLHLIGDIQLMDRGGKLAGGRPRLQKCQAALRPPAFRGGTVERMAV